MLMRTPSALVVDTEVIGVPKQMTFKIIDSVDIAPSWFNLRYNVFVQELSYYEENPREMESDILDSLAFHVLSTVNGKPMGYCRLIESRFGQFRRYFCNSQTGKCSTSGFEVSRFLVRNTARGRGHILNILLGVAVACRMLGETTLLATSPPHLLGMYRRLGAELIRECVIDRKHGNRFLLTLETERALNCLPDLKEIESELNSNNTAILPVNWKHVRRDLVNLGDIARCA